MTDVPGPEGSLVPTTMLVGGVDELDVNIAILNNHIGNRAINRLITPTKIVCVNTERAALNNATASFKIRHTDSAADRVHQAREQLGLTWKYVAQFEAQAERMILGSTQLDYAIWDYIRGVTPRRRRTGRGNS